VLPSYNGFNRETSIEWRELYENSGIENLTDKNKIGYVLTWKSGIEQLKRQNPTEFETYKSMLLNIINH
jgi:hypothetical protein